MHKNPKILIVKLSAIGDIAQSTPIIHALRKKFPGAHLAWAVEDRNSSVLINNPCLNEVIIIPRQKWKKRRLNIRNFIEFWQIIGEIRKRKFDIAIDLQELFKSAVIVGLSGAKRRIAHAGTREFAEIFINEKLPAHDNFDPKKLIVERYLEPAAYLGASAEEVEFSLPVISEETKASVDKLLENLYTQKEIVIFSPATIWESKHWPEEYWAELLDKLEADFNIVFTGTEGDKKLIERIISKSNSQNCLSLAGKTNIQQLMELFYRAKFLVAPDTGPAHIANATQHPAIAMIFGPTGYKRTPPYGEKHIALSTELPCQPCFKRHCPRKDNFMECMKLITPDKVLDFIYHYS